MIKISHTNLELIRRDPGNYRELAKRTFGGPSRFQYVKWAVRTFHRDGLQAALDYLEEAFARRGFRMEAIERYRDYIVNYVGSLEGRPGAVVEVGTRVEMALSPSVLLSGEIGRFDIVPNGYAAWLFFERPPADWSSELRMPLLQQWTANHVGAPLDEIRIGFFSFSDATYENVTYSAGAVQRALREARRLARGLVATD